MADISKCSGADCPLKDSCYRHTAPNGMWQTYFGFVPFNKETNTCDYYWKQENQTNNNEKEDK